VRLAAEVLERYPDGAWLVDLAVLGDERLLEHTVASVCGIKEEAQRPLLDVLADSLSSRRSLIVLDGCEHLVDSCARLTSWLLRSCPKLKILTTSREPLGLTGEVIWRTPSLTIPRPEDAAHPELLMESEATRLFVERARLSRPEFELEASVTPALAQICSRLEGIPLAIELAAGLAGVMTLQEILDRLRHRFRLLTGGSRSSLPRHQTLRQAVDWSYDLLSPTERALFARLSVFAGGFDLAAAEAVTPGDSVHVDGVMPLLSQLVNKSLVIAEPTRPLTTRYRMLDTIREYAQEKLQQSGEAGLRRKHADYFADWTTSATKQLGSLDQVTWLRRLDEEQANIRLALEWSLSEQADNALRLAAAMGAFWWMHRSLTEGFEWLSRALDVETSIREFRAAALVARARLSRRKGDYAAAERDAEECAAISRQLGLKLELARALTMLGIITSHRGDLEAAARYFDESKKLAEQEGDRDRLASSLNNLAMIESGMGRQDLALPHMERALAIADEIGDRFLKATLLETAGRIHLRLGNHDVARRHYAEALTIASEFQDTVNIADCLEGFALIAGRDSSRAVILVSAAEKLRAATGATRTLEWSTEVVEGIAAARGKLGPNASETARRQGGAMSIEEAVRFALGVPAIDRRDGTERLTDREIQVARLVAQGLTNGEVAQRLRIAARTVDSHVEHIRNKLGLRSRSQIAVWAHERLGSG
jgi:non-specific serine/threonine protein kinase